MINIDFVNNHLNQRIKKAKKKRDRRILFLEIVMVALLGFGLVSTFGIGKVSADAMEPSLKKGDYFIYCKVNRDYSKDELVVVEYQQHTLVRRIAGLAKDTVYINNETGELFINDKKENSDYAHGITVAYPGDIKYPLYISHDTYFVLCDQRDYTSDSRMFGAISKKDIKGKVLFIF